MDRRTIYDAPLEDETERISRELIAEFDREHGRPATGRFSVYRDYGLEQTIADRVAFEKQAIEDEIALERIMGVPPKPAKEPPRRWLEERTNPDGSVTRFFNDGSEVTRRGDVLECRNPDGTTETVPYDGFERASEIRVGGTAGLKPAA